MLRLMSAGKSAVLGGQINADLYIDCRIVWNPYRDPELGGKTGDDPLVIAWMKKANPQWLDSVEQMIRQGLQTKGTRNSGKDSSKPFTVCVIRFDCSRSIRAGTANRTLGTGVASDRTGSRRASHAGRLRHSWASVTAETATIAARSGSTGPQPRRAIGRL